MGLKTFIGGVHPKDYKDLSKDVRIETIPLPSRVVIPMIQHIGAPSEPIVKQGDEVLTGQIISNPSAFVSIPMHASISGVVSKIEKLPTPVGTNALAIEITSDGKDQWVELVDEPDYLSLSAEELKKRINDAGICGMGGAGFPTHVKLSPPNDVKIDTVVLNGVECEPYLTSDYRLMIEKGKEIVEGLKIIMKVVNAKKGVVGIESNKPEAIEMMKSVVQKESNLSVVSLKLKYPQGAEKQLIYAATGRTVPNKGGLPMAVGVVVQNVGTAYAIYEAARYKKPLIDRIVTITGSVVKIPKNIKARIGTPLTDMIQFCGGVEDSMSKIISGGPMMGFAIPDLDVPITKTTSGFVLLTEKEVVKYTEHTCLRCGRCVDVCPMNLIPSFIVSSAKDSNWRDSEKYGAMDCMKCGSCAYVMSSPYQISTMGGCCENAHLRIK